MASVLQRVVHPAPRKGEVETLYFVSPTVGGHVPGSRDLAATYERHSLTVGPFEYVSYGTYFNAFPAGYWVHWSELDSVNLELELRGRATVRLFASDAVGAQRLVEQREMVSGSQILNVSLRDFSEGGWLWFTIDTGADEVQIRNGAWTTSEPARRDGKATIGITTFNKPDFCLSTVRTLASCEDLDDFADEVIIVDQGTKELSKSDGFDVAAARLGQRLRVVRQPNLGGSGGFARVMIEALERTGSEFILLLDDDVQIEPEAIRRCVMFARFSRSPLIVGGQMLNMLRPTELHAWAEVIDEKPFVWRPSDADAMPHDLAVRSLIDTPSLHARVDAHYNGWWMCLIPAVVVRAIGLPIPAFIKWDDAEYGLRSRAAGYPTVTLPGVALWHIAWTEKDDFSDWQAYFHARNRILAALLHSPYAKGGTLLRHSRRADMKHLAAMQYYAANLRQKAMTDLMRGPAHLFPSLRDARPFAQQMVAQFRHYEFSEPSTSAAQEPAAVRHPGRLAGRPSRFREAFALTSLVSSFWRRGRFDRATYTVSKARASWWRLAFMDQVNVLSADGARITHYRRDPGQHRSLALSSFRLHRRLRRRWQSLSAEYRSALSDLTAPQTWKEALEERP